MTFASRGELADHSFFYAMVFWAGSCVLWELGQVLGLQDFSAILSSLRSLGDVDPVTALIRRFQKFASDRFNRIDLPGAALALTTLLCMHFDTQDNGSGAPFRSRTRALRAFSVLLLWLKVPRVFLISGHHGP
eukprot:7387645-Prymnesium_polylepis.2